ncbi:hypothetical protein Goshw_003756 [Gossypium schwendimanii]|uniref:RNase H type-1 domain-containing protein n=1 Tax=Gossypium schwendimanii TaxID=34291 RepID=A0A7J9KW63_GOSSC|nr:hypothetical protein [Gossypium schwendimanii]
MNPEEIIKVSCSWVKQYFLAHSEALVMETQQNFKHVDLGGVIRDGKRNWILGYNRFLGKCSVAVAKFWGILDSLLLLQKQGYDDVTFHYDNLEIVIAISDRNFEGSNSTLIKRI